MKQPDVSIIVLCWNHLEDLTKPFLKSIEKTTGVDYELVFWDNGSKDGTYKWLKAQENTWSTHSKRKIKVYGCPQNIGFGAGNNEAVKYATGKYILFLNNDILFHDPKWLQNLFDYAEEHPKTVVGAQLIDFNSATTFRHKMLPYMGGWCMMIDHEWIKKNGAFHPDFGWAYFEDCELSQRAVHTGYTLKQIEVGIEHLGSISSADQLNIPEQFKYNGSVYRNLLLAREKGEKRRIVFFAPQMYPFTSQSYENEGVGGAEASLILLTRELARQGHVVEIYNDTTTEGMFDGVYYYNVENFNYDDYADVFVLFRNSMRSLGEVYAGVKLFWSCDQHTTNDWESAIYPYIDGVIAISKYHKEYLQKHTIFVKSKIEVIDLGINFDDYRETPSKIPGKMIFCSVPRRGLTHLLHMFSEIRRRVPHVELYITSDYSLWGADPDNRDFIAMTESMPHVHYLGKVQRKELVRHQMEAEVMVYPCDYDENFCISAMECLAAGCKVITTKIGALETTVGESGVLIEGSPSEIRYQEKFIEAVEKAFKEDVGNGRNRALRQYNWPTIVKNQWLPYLEKVMQKYQPNYCLDCKQKFSNGYDFFKHRAEKHPVQNFTPPGPQAQKKIMVSIKTRRKVELILNRDINFQRTTDLVVPQESAGDVVRILTEAYGSDIIEKAELARA